ncbi:signal peptidase complex subunit 3-like [Acropora muricata]|uniref:signal peptidase complex subunit 3-like n=1 Tax=Acropora millepora TaxID=45264 RepID=UPI0010FC86BB|nr:signal peptidase complex subunit 3-like [Acropora millepora]
MNTFLSRLNTVFAFTLTVLAALTFLCFLSTFFNTNQATVYLQTKKVLVKNVQDFGVSKDKNDLGFVTFDLQSDLKGIFNWNVKQLFLYLTAEYSTKLNKFNQVVIWDKIILRRDNGLLNYNGMNTKYYFFDDGMGLKGNQNVSLYLSWNVIPNAGILPLITQENKFSFDFPGEYTVNRGDH